MEAVRLHGEHSIDMQQSTMTLIEIWTAYGLWCIGGPKGGDGLVQP